MKNKQLSALSLLLALVMLLGTLASCGGNSSDTTTDSGDAITTETKAAETTETETSSQTTDETDTAQETEDTVLLEGENADLIQTAYDLMNGVNSYYSGGDRDSVMIDNKVMNLSYNIKSNSNNMQIGYLSTPDGKPYITDTMDVFVKMKDGNTYYSSKSINDASLNIYRYGYYYYENRIEGQTFINDIAIEKELVLDHTKISGKNAIKSPEIKDGMLSYKNMDSSKDPWVSYNLGFEATDYDYLEITMRVANVTNRAEIFLIAGSATTYTTKQRYEFQLIDDGEFHTYRIPLSEFNDYTGTVKNMRLDLTTKVGALVEISGMRVFKGSYGSAPTDLTIQRSFLAYSDKLHHLVQFSTPTAVKDVESVGMLTKISADTVAKIAVKDKGGLKYTLDGVDWASVEYVGFDIKDAGIFGYILPCDDKSGSISVTLADGVYTVTQTVVPTNNELIPSKTGTRNKNDLFFGQRIYNDEEHEFDTFIKEAECERHPLTEKNFKVNIYQDGAKFQGYQPLYGYYKFSVSGTGFNPAYFTYPNRQFRVSFEVVGDKYDRQMYFCTFTNSGNLESAVLLNGVDMVLPVAMEVAKNFTGDGENTIYNLDDAAYGEAYFPMIVKADESRKYTVTNLYQNWGSSPLKQISSIQFHTPYYHLSTGVTETNCIVQMATAGPGLPDHRAMSAPFWPTQPQHNSGGGHTFFRYTDNDENWNASENTFTSIDSYGPTYCDISIGYDSFDGKISATYTHTEMPQVDENRAFYEMKYVFNEDVSFENFADQFTIYNVTNNDPTGSYQKVGYLDVNNECKVVDAVKKGASSQRYILGDECPYFSFFDMPDYDKTNKHAYGYTNLSFIVYNYEIISNGEKVDANLFIVNSHAATAGNKGYVRIGINLKEISFKAGDTITLNTIIMPWGSQESDYSGAEPDGNVREVRRNTLLNPMKATAGKDCEVVESVFVPKVKSTDGKSAEFTISGGHDNVAVRVYGFDLLSVPKIEEYVGGKWVEYKVNSISSPDDYGFGYYYDGYMAHYDGDGTYSYSFIVKMNKGAERTFRIAPDEGFKGWPEVKVEAEEEEKEPDPINVYVDASEFHKSSLGSATFTKTELAEDGSYIRFYPNPTSAEAYMTPYSGTVAEYSEVKTTGQYFVIRYRAPKDLPSTGKFEFFCSTEQSSATGNGENFHYSDIINDGEWHTVIIDLSKKIPTQFVADADGKYFAQFLRFDVFNSKNLDKDSYIDIAYIGLSDSFEKLIELNADLETVTFENGGKIQTIDTATGKEFVEPAPVFVDPESGFTMTEVPFASWLDFFCKNGIGRGVAFDKDPSIYNYNGKTIDKSLAVLTGWCIAEGGIEKYVWSADGGKTWNDVVLYNKEKLDNAPNADYYAAVTSISATKYVIKDEEASKVNVSFQSGKGNGGIAADLSDYVGQTVNVCFAAVPKADPESLCVLLYIKNVEVLPPEVTE